MKNPIIVDAMNGQIVIMSRTFEKKASCPNTSEYSLLQNVRRDYPNFTVVRREIKKPDHAIDRYAGLTYEYMKWYINNYEDKNNRKDMLETFQKIMDIAKCHSRGKRYMEIRNWFLDTYPEIKTYGITAKMPDSATVQDNITEFPESVEAAPAA